LKEDSTHVLDFLLCSCISNHPSLWQPPETLLRSQQCVVDRMGWHQAELLL
jgi:hypothetical protein